MEKSVLFPEGFGTIRARVRFLGLKGHIGIGDFWDRRQEEGNC